MQLRLISPPADLAVPLGDVRDHIGLEPGDAESEITVKTIAATAVLDGPHGLLGRALVTQRWCVCLDSFQDDFTVPLPPTQSVDAIRYFDAAGVFQTLDPAAYAVRGTDPAVIMRANTAWPTVQKRPDAVQIEITAGYGDFSIHVPPMLRHAIAAYARHLFDDREFFVPARLRTAPHGFEQMIQPYRVGGF